MMTDKILILGANGMLGGSIFRYLSKHTSFCVLGSVRTDESRLDLARQGFENVVVGIDVRNETQLAKLIAEIKPKWVINCVGVIKQLNESKVPIPTIAINSLLPHQIATLCNQTGARLIHFSTDCVFAGKSGMYRETSHPDATDLYGRSKLLGEVAYGPHLTLRTSIIGHELHSNVSLVDWFLSQQGSIKGFSKAVFSGLPTVYVAEFLANFVVGKHSLSGLYHLSASPIDKYSLLDLVKKQYQKDIEINENKNFVINRSLDANRLNTETGFQPADWPELISKMHNEYQTYFA